MPSTEERRRHEVDLERGLNEDEMDIGAMVASAPVSQDHDLLGFSPPRSQLPNAARLGIASAQPLSIVERRDGANDDESDASSIRDTGTRSGPQSIKSDSYAGPRPYHHGRVSYDAGLVSRDGRFGRPWDIRRGARRNSHPVNLYHDDAEGDLGYSAVHGSEGARRRVIAERLETVKSRNPVFTWC